MRPLVTEKKPSLSAQAWFGSALLSLYQVTGNEEWLEQAISLANAMKTNLLRYQDRRILCHYC